MKSLQIGPIYPVSSHTDHIGPGSTFVAVAGFVQHGIEFVPLALEKGAQKVVIDRSVTLSDALLGQINTAGAQLIRVDDARNALAHLSAQAAGFPTKKLSIVGVTGTKGKTTTVHMTAHLLRAAGYRVALLSTAYNAIDSHYISASLTTAHPDYLHQFFKTCVDEGITHVVMEVAAQGISLHRVAGILFDRVVFTNFSLEHLEFYPDLQSYFDAKAQLLTMRAVGAPAFVNTDDDWCARLLNTAQNMISFGQLTGADIQISLGIQECSLTWHKQQLRLKNDIFIGEYNAYNLASASAIALSYGISCEHIQQAVRTIASLRGRLERYQLPQGATAIIDYAHNPASYHALLSALRPMTPHLIVVFGAGGKRDASRRPLMGEAAATYADLIVLTTDNPRGEDPQLIVNSIKAGISPHLQDRVVCELDRANAIGFACKQAKYNSIVVLLGKGPDEYQILVDVKEPFSEVAILKQLGAHPYEIK